MNRFNRRWVCADCGKKYKTRRTWCKMCGSTDYERPHMRS